MGRVGACVCCITPELLFSASKPPPALSNYQVAYHVLLLTAARGCQVERVMTSYEDGLFLIDRVLPARLSIRIA